MEEERTEIKTHGYVCSAQIKDKEGKNHTLWFDRWRKEVVMNNTWEALVRYGRLEIVKKGTEQFLFYALFEDLHPSHPKIVNYVDGNQFNMCLHNVLGDPENHWIKNPEMTGISRKNNRHYVRFQMRHKDKKKIVLWYPPLSVHWKDTAEACRNWRDSFCQDKDMKEKILATMKDAEE